MIVSGTTEELTQKAAGLAWSLIVNSNEHLEQYEASYCISNLRRTSTGVDLLLYKTTLYDSSLIKGLISFKGASIAFYT